MNLYNMVKNDQDNPTILNVNKKNKWINTMYCKTVNFGCCLNADSVIKEIYAIKKCGVLGKNSNIWYIFL